MAIAKFHPARRCLLRPAFKTRRSVQCGCRAKEARKLGVATAGYTPHGPTAPASVATVSDQVRDWLRSTRCRDPQCLLNAKPGDDPQPGSCDHPLKRDCIQSTVSDWREEKRPADRKRVLDWDIGHIPESMNGQYPTTTPCRSRSYATSIPKSPVSAVSGEPSAHCKRIRLSSSLYPSATAVGDDEHCRRRSR